MNLEQVQARSVILAEHGDDIFHGDDKQAVIAFEVHWNPSFGIEEDPVILLDGIVDIIGDLGTDGHDPAGDGRNLHLVRKVDADLGNLTILVLSDENAATKWLNHFNRLDAGA